MTDISKVLGTKWKELPTEEKKQFEEDAKKLSVQYKADKAQYDKENPQDKKRKGKGSDDESDDDEGKAKKKGKKAKKDPNAPKQKLSAYMIWSGQEGREMVKKDNPDLKPTEVMGKLGEVWRGMSADEKKPWEDKALADKERFDKEAKEYKGVCVFV